MSAPSARRRLRIDRLELDLRGIAPATADAAARALGPALARALTSRRAHVVAADRVEAGSVVSPAPPNAPDLAARIAQRIAHTIRGEDA